MILPILQPSTWQAATEVLVRPFVPGLTGSPLLALVRPDGDNLRYVGGDEVRRAAELEREAVAFAATLVPPWREVQLELGVTARVLAHPSASEVILSPDVMQRAHAALGPELVAAIPRRGMLVATAAANAPALARFVQLAIEQPSDQPVLTRQLFGVRDGLMVGTWGEQGPRASNPEPRPEVERERPPYGMRFAAELEGTQLPVFALLVPRSWEKRDTHACRPLIAGLEEPTIPLVAPVYLLPQGDGGPPDRAFLANERMPGPYEAVAQEAYANIALRPLPWLPKVVQGHEIVLCVDDYLAAEHVLVPAVLADLTRGLGGGPIVVGIPHRGQLVATSFQHFERGDVFADVFQLYVRHAHAQGGAMGITPSLFVVANGAISGVME